MDLLEIRQNQKRHPWELSRADMVSKTIKSIIKNKPINIADIGSGDMYFADRLLTNLPAVKITAVDLGFDSNVRENGIVMLNNVSQMDDKTQDMILLMDVLEHVADDSSFLTDVATKMNPASDVGTMLITVPAFECLWSKKDDFVKHYRRYTIRSLKRAIKKAGLKPVRMQYFYSSLIPLRILEKMRNKDNCNEVGNWGSGERSFSTRLIRFVLNTDFMVNKALSHIGISLPGLSVMAIVKK